MTYPIILKRKPRTGAIAATAVFTVLTVALSVYFAAEGKELWFYIVAAVLFALSLAFNIFLSVENVYIVEKDRFRSLSRLTPKIDIGAKNFTSVRFTEDGVLRLAYNTDEVIVPNSPEAKKFYDEGLYVCFINKSDVSLPLDVLQNILINMAGENGNDLTCKM
ncbi:MAG: hypothetical protein ACI4N6_05450 [Eubacteriales bacterium]